MLVLLLPTAKATPSGIGALFTRSRFAEPASPPSVKALLATLLSNVKIPAVVAITVLPSKALSLVKMSAPPLIVVVPEKVLVPARVKAPPPALIRLPEPLMAKESVCGVNRS